MSANSLMKTSKAGLDFIARWEGCVLKPYKDIAGLRTIGIGHLIKPNENFPDGVEITKEKALELLAEDVKKCEDSIIARIKVPLNQNQFDALVSFGFNCGTGVYVLSDACKSLNAGDYKTFPEKLLQWSKVRINGVLQQNKGLYNRRTSEGELFSRPVAAANVQTVTEENQKDKPVEMLMWDSSTLKSAQSSLQSLNLYSLKIDGIWGRGTLAGLTTFAKSKNLSLGQDPRKGVPMELFTALKNASEKNEQKIV